MQDVAYGVNKIKFNSGDERKVANSILTMKYDHTIAYYHQFCSKTSFEPFSESTLWRILMGINPSQIKSLAGLDYITATEINGFSTLLKAAESIKTMDLAKDLETGKHYTKAKFLNKCNASSKLSTHSTSFALSDETDLALQQSHCASLSAECGDCHLLLSSLSEVDKQAAEHGNPDLFFFYYNETHYNTSHLNMK